MADAFALRCKAVDADQEHFASREYGWPNIVGGIMRASLKLSTIEIRLLKTIVERAWASVAAPATASDRDLRLLVRNISMDKAGQLALTPQKWARLASIMSKGVENLRSDGRPDAVEMAGHLIERVRAAVQLTPETTSKRGSAKQEPPNCS